ncbi:MAG: aldo/keto reductase [Oscillospiraceae bacterium]|nr:aldo/keto reductase [Oscillospiraceae bacterium]
MSGRILYRDFGNTGIKVSALGFGAMRLPMKDARGGAKQVDYDVAVPTILRAFELGVNYIDTAPFYCDSDSETAVGMALKSWADSGGGQVYLSTKNPSAEGDANKWRSLLEGSLKKLGRSHIDFYHMWGISLERFKKYIDVKGGHIESAMKAKEEGLIKHISFSYHDSADNMAPIVDSGYFESVLCQYNLLDRSNEKAIAYARGKGLGVVVMGPVGGGRLGAPSEVIRGMLKKDIRSTAEMALRFVLANSNVDIALSGMRSIENVEENAKVAAIEGTLTDSEMEQIDRMLEENKRLAELYCTGCKYCMPCPQNVNIPHVFSLMNYHKVYGLTDHAKSEYAQLAVPLEERENNWARDRGYGAAACVECGECEGKCPQHIKIMQQLKDTHAALT